MNTERGADTRKRILEAAAALFLDRGFGATSMQDILAATGLTKGGFYFHFQSKRELAVEVIEVVREDFREAILQRAGLHPRAVDQLAEIIRAAAFEKRAQPAMSAFGRLCQELTGEPEVAEQIKPYEAWITLTAELMHLATAQGDMDPEVDIETAAPLAVAAFVGLDLLADLSRTDITPEQAEQFITFAFRGAGMAPPSERSAERGVSAGADSDHDTPGGKPS